MSVNRMSEEKMEIFRGIQELVEQMEVDEDMFLGDSVIYMKMARTVKNPEIAFLIDAQTRMARKQMKKDMDEIKTRLDSIPKIEHKITDIEKMIRQMKEEQDA